MLNANGKSLGRLQDWHWNCNNLAGNSRLIKYQTRLDWCRASIIIRIQRQSLERGGSPVRTPSLKKAQTSSTETAWREFSLSHLLLIATSCSRSAQKIKQHPLHPQEIWGRLWSWPLWNLLEGTPMPGQQSRGCYCGQHCILGWMRDNVERLGARWYF